MTVKKSFTGTWHIQEMEQWDEDYFNVEVQAYIEVKKNGTGEFQFGLVSGSLYGELVQEEDREWFEFTWEGMDEHHEVSGGGWFKLQDKNIIKGRIMVEGSGSWFLARRIR